MGPVTVPAPLLSGRTADVYAEDDRRVLRRYRAGGDVRAEAEVMRHLRAAMVRAEVGPLGADRLAEGAALVRQLAPR